MRITHLKTQRSAGVDFVPVLRTRDWTARTENKGMRWHRGKWF